MLNLSQPTRLHVRRNATDTDAMGTERRIDMAKAFADLYPMADFVSIWVATDVFCLWLCGHQVIDPLSVNLTRSLHCGHGREYIKPAQQVILGSLQSC
ncbi:unnamed protein product [Vitrella brassicaformis CCMP3155]|uniref:Uncharacterized protein n=1 Tax=Vitrella brassicaformis (strain CCMP3155) TaxID=1169540 RepID=A0A0G4GFC3_VITBC|nr:unnamed protein product [Vitrella brassicaformis CCMP3155]|eukprot:CEM28242.1 unnamed protein product [Vitrella brassicaformis CCMP3155]